MPTGRYQTDDHCTLPRSLPFCHIPPLPPLPSIPVRLCRCPVCTTAIHLRPTDDARTQEAKPHPLSRYSLFCHVPPPSTPARLCRYPVSTTAIHSSHAPLTLTPRKGSSSCYLPLSSTPVRLCRHLVKYPWHLLPPHPLTLTPRKDMHPSALFLKVATTSWLTTYWCFLFHCFSSFFLLC